MVLQCLMAFVFGTMMKLYYVNAASQVKLIIIFVKNA